MKKILVAIVLTITSTLMAAEKEGYVLHWQIYQGDEEYANISYARLYASIDGTDGGIQLAQAFNPNGTYGQYASRNPGPWNASEWATGVADNEASGNIALLYEALNDTTRRDAVKFYLEVAYNGSERTSQKYGEMASYEQLLNMGAFTYKVGSTETPLSPDGKMVATWYAGQPMPVPEPTGGMLALLGMAMLALRRKRV